VFLRILLALALAPLPFTTSPLSAQRVMQVNTDEGGLAIYGYDPVAYFTDGKPVLGSAAFTATHDGATWRFASAAHRELFVKSPARYAPQYGGYCAFGVVSSCAKPRPRRAAGRSRRTSQRIVILNEVRDLYPCARARPGVSVLADSKAARRVAPCTARRGRRNRHPAPG
jgi:YHS domain-containing protein